MKPASARILIIEDDAAVRQTLADILELNGYTVSLAVDGAAGLAAVRTEAPALVITDIAMPRLDGFGILTALRRDPDTRALPVIVLTARADRASMRRGMELGADDFITKPFTEDEVLHSIAARLEKRELLDELDAFAHTVAHDLKGPLSTLFGRLDLLGLLLGQTDEASLRRHLQEATRSARRLNEIIEELLVLSGVRRQQVEPVPLELAGLAAEAVDRLEALLRETEARVELPPAWPPACGHAPWVIEIWVNYISNAAKYSGPQPRITLGAEAVAEGARTRCWVRDYGPGLDAEAQAKLFVPFSRITTVRAKGHGLGLSIVRRIAEKLGGSAGVTSTPGAGALFWFELPARPTAAKPPAGP